jgi:SAM-dependent methyltransferase
MTHKSRDLERFYLVDYENIMSGGLVGHLWKHIHRLIDKPLESLNRPRIIEVGSGNGQHFSQTKLSSIEYLEVDIREDMHRFLDLEKSKANNRRFEIGDATTLTHIKDRSYEALISTCLFAHLRDLELAIVNWNRVVTEDGSLVIYVPCEPGILLRFIRYFSTKRKIQKAGYDHSYIHWREHRNHYPLMKSVITSEFANHSIKIKKFPFNFLPWDCNLFSLFIIKKNQYESKRTNF